MTNDIRYWRMNQSREAIRAELFSIERLEQHAESLAAAQRTAPRRFKSKKLLPRVRENHRFLTQGYRSLARAIGEERAITPAAEWLIDNFHIVEEQIREIIDDLPPAFTANFPNCRTAICKATPHLRRGLGVRRPYGQPF